MGGYNGPGLNPVGNLCPAEHLERVEKALRAEFGQSVANVQIGVGTSLWGHLRFDSIDRVRLAVAIEDEFEIVIPAIREEQWNSIGDICLMLDDLVPA